MKKKYITLEEVLALRGTDTKIYIDGVTETYFVFVDNVLCSYNKDNELFEVGTTAFKEDTHYIIEPEEFKIEKTGKYITRDGKDVYVSCVDDSDFVFGVIKGTRYSIEWYKSGKVAVGENNLDLVEYVGD